MKLLKIRTENPNVFLKQFSVRDSPHIFFLINKSRKHLSQNGDVTAGKYKAIEDVSNSIRFPSNSEKLRFGIWDNKKLVGSINLTPNNKDSAEIGYYLGAGHTGFGYATIATKALIDYSFATGYKSLSAKVVEENYTSTRVLKRAGLHKRDSNESFLFYIER